MSACFYSIPQSLEANWRRGHYTLTSVQTGSTVLCLQYDDNKIVTGHYDSTIKVGSCLCVLFPLCPESLMFHYWYVGECRALWGEHE